MTTVALATTHEASELEADLVVQDLSALSVRVTDGGVEISTRGWRYPPLSAMRTAVWVPPVRLLYLIP